MSKRVAGWPIVTAGSRGTLTVGGVVDGLLINNVTSGWAWVAGAAVLTLLLAFLAGWLGYRNSAAQPEPEQPPPTPTQGEGAVVVANESEAADIKTDIEDVPSQDQATQQLAPGAVLINNKSRVGNINTKVTGHRAADGTPGQ